MIGTAAPVIRGLTEHFIEGEGSRIFALNSGPVDLCWQSQLPS